MRKLFSCLIMLAAAAALMALAYYIYLKFMDSL